MDDFIVKILMDEFVDKIWMIFMVGYLRREITLVRNDFVKALKSYVCLHLVVLDGIMCLVSNDFLKIAEIMIPFGIHPPMKLLSGFKVIH